jgi:hypothetical protein
MGKDTSTTDISGADSISRAWLVANWIGVGLAVLGTFFVSALREPYVGHWIWISANTVLIAYSIKNKAWPFVFMFAVYFVLSAIGVVTWSH